MSSQVVSRTPCPKCREAGNDTQGNNLINHDDGHSYCYACNYLIKGDGESMPLDSATIRTDQPTITLQGIAGPTSSFM